MGRTEDRALKKKGLSDRDILGIKLDNAYQKGYRQGMRKSIAFVYYMTAYTINYKLSFGSKRLKQIMHDIYNNIDSYRTGHLENADYAEIKRQMNKLGVKINENIF